MFPDGPFSRRELLSRAPANLYTIGNAHRRSIGFSEYED